MEFLHATVTNNYFASFRLLTHLGVDNIWATKIGYANALSLGTNSRKKKKKKNEVTLHNVHQAKKQWKFGSGWFERQQAVYIASSKFSEPKRFVRLLNKVQGKYIQQKQPN